MCHIYSSYRLSHRFIHKRLKYFYKDFHRNYCFSLFMLSPSPSISLRPVHTSAKSSAPNQMPDRCLPTATTLQFLPAPPSLRSRFPTTTSQCPSRLLPPVLHPHLLFAKCSCGFVLTSRFPAYTPFTSDLALQSQHPSKYTMVNKYTLTSKRVQTEVSFNQSCECLRRLRLVPYT